jgi:hypothetical protein
MLFNAQSLAAKLVHVLHHSVQHGEEHKQLKHNDEQEISVNLTFKVQGRQPD